MAADKSVRVEVRGIRELQGAFKQMDNGMDKALRVAFKEIAETVAVKVRAQVPRGRTGRAAASVKARASNRGASIAFGGTMAPYFPFLDFGGSVGRGHKVGRAWSGAIKREWRGLPGGSGRYVYPTIKSERDHIEAAVSDAVGDLAHKAGFETRGGL